MKLLELQTILNQILLKKCTHTALTDMFYKYKAIICFFRGTFLTYFVKMYPENCHLKNCYLCSRG